MTSQGKVYLVGAGPGDPELLTLKAQRLITTCDALVYDYLVAENLLEWTKDGCEHHYVGKRKGFHSMPQADIETLLLNLAQAGKTVVRLKGGDPFIFGRGGEELRRMRDASIPCEVVPGITAAVGAASQAGIPLTHRGINSSLIFLTGHEDPAKGTTTVNWRAYGSLGATLCIYMGMGRLEHIINELQAGGLSADTPVQIIQWACTDKEKKLLSNAQQVVADTIAAGLDAPAIIIIGEAAAGVDAIDLPCESA